MDDGKFEVNEESLKTLVKYLNGAAKRAKEDAEKEKNTKTEFYLLGQEEGLKVAVSYINAMFGG